MARDRPRVGARRLLEGGGAPLESLRDPLLNMQLMPPQGYAVYCVDRPDSLELRTKTRSAHLAWLEERPRPPRRTAARSK